MGCESQKLRNEQQVVAEAVLRTALCLIGAGSLCCLNSFLSLRSLRFNLGSILFIDLDELGQLLFGLSKLCLEGRLLEDLCFLIGVDDLGSHKVVKGFSLVFSNQGIGSRGIGLRQSVRDAFERKQAQGGTDKLFVDVADVPVQYVRETCHGLSIQNLNLLLQLPDVWTSDGIVCGVGGFVGGGAGRGRFSTLSSLCSLLLGRLRGHLGRCGSHCASVPVGRRAGCWIRVWHEGTRQG